MKEKEFEQRQNEGYIITDSIHIGDAEFVIGENHTRFGTMYVTWRCKDGDNYFWGHYMQSRQAAERDLIDRAQRQLEQTMDRQEDANSKEEQQQELPEKRERKKESYER